MRASTVKVKVSFTDGDGHSETRTSDPSGTVAAANACLAPDFGTRRNIWTGTVTIADLAGAGSQRGFYGSDGSISPSTFTIGANTYTVTGVTVFHSGSFDGRLAIGLNSRLTSAELAAARLHVCDQDLDFGSLRRDATVPFANTYDTRGTYQSIHFDWSSPITSRTLYISLPANNDATGAPTISGTDAAVGTELTAATTAIMDADGLPSSFSYQWVRVASDDSETDITGQTSSTYTLASADDGKRVKVKVSFTDNLSGMEEVKSEAYPEMGTVGAANTAATGKPTVTGTPESGLALAAHRGDIADTDGLPSGEFPAGYTFQWVRVVGGVETDITDATGRTHTLGSADVGNTLRVKVSFTDGRGYSETRISDAYPDTGSVTALCPVPNFGSRRHFWTGNVTVGVNNPESETPSYGIRDADFGSLDEENFTIGATEYEVTTLLVTTGSHRDGNFSFELAEDMEYRVGGLVRLHACAAAFDLNDVYVDLYTMPEPDQGESKFEWENTALDWSSASTRRLYLSLPANNDATGAPTVTGTERVGETLTANLNDIADADGLPATTFPMGYSFQWVRVDSDGSSNPTDIPGATSQTYRPGADDVGKRLKVKVGFKDRLHVASYTANGVMVANDPGETRESVASGTVAAGMTTMAGVLVSNTGKSQSSTDHLINDRAQAFTTGPNSTGYTLTSVDVALVVAPSGTEPVFTVAIWGSTALGEPDSSNVVGTLESPTITTGVNNFPASGSGLPLTKNTTYFVVVDVTTSGSRVAISNTAADSEDTGGAAGWSIGDMGYLLTTVWASQNDARRIAVRGHANSTGMGENTAPTFADAALSRRVAENSPAGTNVGAAIPEAQDAEGDTLTYTIEGADAAAFGFNATTRQITTKAGVTYDFEARSSYAVTVKADDRRGGTDTVAVSITLTDVDEPAGRARRAGGDPDPGLDHQPRGELDGAGQRRASPDNQLRPALLRGFGCGLRRGQRLQQRPAERDGHVLDPHRPDRGDGLPGAGAREQRRGRRRVVGERRRRHPRDAQRRAQAGRTRFPTASRRWGRRSTTRSRPTPSTTPTAIRSSTRPCSPTTASCRAG